ncbi:hypothetical protein GIB67_036184 [Kingdonia uniflora]|uniref:Ubiquitin carboxyl-terminal hydrolase n=1 Tax=Kingdonia uniflora TaxID=39325 RepID=A0A7J7N9M4_9MAGN|nr:hypothetical protein GIB67_036184 [Kingdonia uniflora]
MEIQGFNKGYKILIPKYWGSVSRFRVIGVGVFGISCLIFALSDGNKIGYLPSSISNGRRSSDKLKVVAGLRNLGNNCFLNVILQALASCACFLPFLRDKIVEEDGFSMEEERIDRTPLTLALVSLLEELCITHDNKMALNPRRVMAAMDDYIPSFHLTSQQDAAEAFLHLLSSLKDEFSGCYVPNHGSLADIIAFRQCRVFNPKREGRVEWERWQQYFLGPLDGIICSSLMCRSCSSQISTEFEFFHSLPLSLLLNSSSETIMNQCSIEDCLKKFTATELLENYRCNHCWHLKATKYLSTIGGNETHIEKLRCCAEQDTCDCRNVFPQERMPWSDDFSRTTKQLRIARCPKILCIHLQRASVNMFGELVKLQGHVSFPLILDLFPFSKDAIGVGTESLNELVTRMQVKHDKPQDSCLNSFKLQPNRELLQHIYGPVNEIISSEALVEDEGELFLHNSKSYLNSEFTDMSSNNKVGKSRCLVPSKSYKYHLVSVVEHFGRVGSGHYTVYRRVADESDGETLAGRSKSETLHWFCASDSDVLSVSQEDVLSAEASLIFYERDEGHI